MKISDSPYQRCTPTNPPLEILLIESSPRRLIIGRLGSKVAPFINPCWKEMVGSPVGPGMKNRASLKKRLTIILVSMVLFYCSLEYY